MLLLFYWYMKQKEYNQFILFNKSLFLLHSIDSQMSYYALDLHLFDIFESDILYLNIYYNFINYKFEDYYGLAIN